MSEEEFQNASKGTWADGPLVANTSEAGFKWLWTSKNAAVLWRDKMVAAGELDLLVAQVPTAHPVSKYIPDSRIHPKVSPFWHRFPT